MTTVYIGAIEGDGLTVATADPATGALTVSATVSEAREPSFLAFAEDGRTLYAVVEESEGAVTALDITEPTAPTVGQVVPTGASGPTHLCVHNGHLAVAHYSDGTVTAHPLASDGAVGAPTSRLRHDAAEPHAHQVVSAGQWLVAVDLGADAVFTHRIDDGVLTEHARLDAPRGTGPRHIAFHADKAFLLGEYIPGVTRLDWNADGGTFTVTGHSLVTGQGAPETFPAEIVVDPAGGHLYTSNRGEDVIAVLGLDGALRQSVTTGGSWPRHCAIDPTGRWLYVANQRTDSVVWLPRDPVTGWLGEPVGSITVRGACVVAFT